MKKYGLLFKIIAVSSISFDEYPLLKSRTDAFKELLASNLHGIDSIPDKGRFLSALKGIFAKFSSDKYSEVETFISGILNKKEIFSTFGLKLSVLVALDKVDISGSDSESFSKLRLGFFAKQMFDNPEESRVQFLKGLLKEFLAIESFGFGDEVSFNFEERDSGNGSSVPASSPVSSSGGATPTRADSPLFTGSTGSLLREASSIERYPNISKSKYLFIESLVNFGLSTGYDRVQNARNTLLQCSDMRELSYCLKSILSNPYSKAEQSEIFPVIVDTVFKKFESNANEHISALKVLLSYTFALDRSVRRVLKSIIFNSLNNPLNCADPIRDLLADRKLFQGHSRFKSKLESILKGLDALPFENRVTTNPLFDGSSEDMPFGVNPHNFDEIIWGEAAVEV
jgi:hypothetical protein